MKFLCLDPGESTGCAIFEDDTLIEAGTLDAWEMIDVLDDALTPDGDLFSFEGAANAGNWEGIELVVMEDWVLYPWAAEAQVWDKQRTVRVIGAVELLCRQHGIPLVLQPAKIKESAEAGGAEAYFKRPLHPNRHANDAIRHGVYYRQTTQFGAGPGSPTGNTATAAERAPEKPQSPSSDQSVESPTPPDPA